MYLLRRLFKRSCDVTKGLLEAQGGSRLHPSGSRWYKRKACNECNVTTYDNEMCCSQRKERLYCKLQSSEKIFRFSLKFREIVFSLWMKITLGQAMCCCNRSNRAFEKVYLLESQQRDRTWGRGYMATWTVPSDLEHQDACLPLYHSAALWVIRTERQLSKWKPQDPLWDSVTWTWGMPSRGHHTGSWKNPEQEWNFSEGV